MIINFCPAEIYPKKIRRARGKGFSLPELVMAILVFGMVMAALASIYATFWRQRGTIMQGQNRLNAMGSAAVRAIQQEVSLATRVDSPAAGGSAHHLQGGRNVAADDPAPKNPIVSGPPVSWFHFCVQSAANALVPQCGAGTQDSLPCLWYYQGGGWPPPITVTDSNCGQVLTGTVPMLLASGVVCPSASPTDCFSRQAPEANQVRVSFTLSRAATPTSPAVSYQADTTFSGHFASGF